MCLFQPRLQPGKNKPASLAKAKHTRPNYQLPHCSFGPAGILPAFVLLLAPCLQAASFDSAPRSRAERDPAGKLRKGYCLTACAPPQFICWQSFTRVYLCKELVCLLIRGKLVVLLHLKYLCMGKAALVCLGSSRLCVTVWVLGVGHVALTVWLLSVWQPVPWLTLILAALGRAREDGRGCLCSCELPQLSGTREGTWKRCRGDLA